MLQNLRTLIKKYDLNAYLIPNKDPHQSEYLPAHFRVMPTLTGFTGSTGTMIVSDDFAGVWTDSRYFIQAERELKDSPFELVKLKIPHTPEYVDWLLENTSEGGKVGVDTQLLSISAFDYLKKKLSQKQIEIVALDLLTPIWENRPKLSEKPVFKHNIAFAGKSRTEKINAIRAELTTLNATHTLLTALDDIAWLFNIRCDDVQCNPVAVAYAIIGQKTTTLFINPIKITADLKAQFEAQKINIESYENINHHLESLPNDTSIYVDPGQLNYALFEIINSKYTVQKGLSLPYAAKAIKNETEIANLKNVMLKDGVAMVRLLKWLEENVASETITEISLDEKLYEYRAAQEHFIGESFGTIAGYKGHGAIVHYGATEATNVTLKPEGVLLLDSGGQYLDGTTDITRTIALGTPTAEEKRSNTLVLKGHIALDKIQFLKGMVGNQLDVLARAALWEHGLNYGHGTGHGVGFFLNVHEGPHSFGRGATANPKAHLQPGMLITNEPGFYKADEYGIRIENILLVVDGVKTATNTFYKFETLTLCPIDKNLINKDLLTRFEVQWLNDYHQKVYEMLSPRLTEEEVIWLKEKTSKL